MKSSVCGREAQPAPCEVARSGTSAGLGWTRCCEYRLRLAGPAPEICCEVPARARPDLRLRFRGSMPTEQPCTRPKADHRRNVWLEAFQRTRAKPAHELPSSTRFRRYL